MRGTYNIQSYINSCQLPELKLGPGAPLAPPLGHKSHTNHLQITAERPRRLEQATSTFKDMDFVHAWIARKFPKAPLNAEDEDEELGENLTLPSGPMQFSGRCAWRKPVEDLHKLGDWLEDLPIVTVQRLLHLVEADTLRWRFKRVHEKDPDQDIFQYFMWTYGQSGASTPLSQESMEQIATKSVIVAFQPPWILSRADMEQFSKATFINLESNDLSSKDRLWGKLWDICVRNDIHYFVLTSYEQWIFGVFSRHWDTGCISNVFEYNSHGPSVTECLVYWIASAMRLNTNVILPKGSTILLKPLVRPPAYEEELKHIPDASESNWTGQSDDVASSAGYYTASVSSKVSDGGVYPTSAPINKQPRDTEYIRWWTIEQLRTK